MVRPLYHQLLLPCKEAFILPCVHWRQCNAASPMYNTGEARLPTAARTIEQHHTEVASTSLAYCKGQTISLGCRYIVASSADALYVAFMGTKVLRDYLADANYLQAALWPGAPAQVRSSSLRSSFTYARPWLLPMAILAGSVTVTTPWAAIICRVVVQLYYIV